MLIIMIIGRKKTGKTTSISLLKKHYDVIELNFADTLKAVCKNAFSLSNEQLYDQEQKERVDSRWEVSPRVIFQKIGDLFRDYLTTVLPTLKLREKSIFTDILRYKLEEIQTSLNVKSVCHKCQKGVATYGLAGQCYTHCDDCRESEMTNKQKLIIIGDGRLPDEAEFAKRMGIPTIEIIKNTGCNDTHISEKLDFEKDYTIENNGTFQELEDKLNNVLLTYTLISEKLDFKKDYTIEYNGTFSELEDKLLHTLELI